MNIGIGTLIIINNDDSLIYKFKPSQQLEESLIKTTTTGINPLSSTLEQILVNKITNTYKDIMS